MVLALWKAGANANVLHKLKHIVLQTFKPELWKRDLIFPILPLGAASCVHKCLVHLFVTAAGFCWFGLFVIVWALVFFFFLNGYDLAGRNVPGHKKLFTKRPVLSAQIENYTFTYWEDCSLLSIFQYQT